MEISAYFSLTLYGKRIVTTLCKDVVLTSPFSKSAPTIAEAMSTQSYTVPQNLELTGSVHTFQAVYIHENSVHVGDCVKYSSQGEVCVCMYC